MGTVVYARLRFVVRASNAAAAHLQRAAEVTPGSEERVALLASAREKLAFVEAHTRLAFVGMEPATPAAEKMGRALAILKQLADEIADERKE